MSVTLLLSHFLAIFTHCDAAALGLSLYRDQSCQSAAAVNYEVWEVSESGCCTVNAARTQKYLQYVCVDGGLLELRYAESGCTGAMLGRSSKTRNWWDTMARGGCTFDDKADTYIKFNSYPPTSFQTRASGCNAPPAVKLFKYTDRLCTNPSGEEELKKQPSRYEYNGCLDVTITDAGPASGSRGGAKFQCSDGIVTHGTFMDYLYCSGESLSDQMHTWAWFHAYTSGECVPDLRSDSYLRLTTAMPSSWLTHMQTCSGAAIARVRPFASSSSCEGAVNASSVVEWAGMSADGCISVTQTSRTLPHYSQRFRCKGSGEKRRIFLEYFAGSSCKASLDAPILSTPEWNFTGWLGILNGSCHPALDGFQELDGLSPENKATILSTLAGCTEEPDAADEGTIAPSASSTGTVLVTSTTVLASSSLASNLSVSPSGLRGVAKTTNSGTVRYFLSKVAVVVSVYASVGSSN